MFVRRISGVSKESDPEAERREHEAYGAAMRTYQGFLKTLDLSATGDLLLFFGRDFFHDAEIERVSLEKDGRNVVIRLRQWIEGDFPDDSDLPDQMVFEAAFNDVVWFLAKREPGGEKVDEFLYSEIDGLEEQLSTIKQEHGEGFHSLAIECDGGWLALIFRSVRVSPEDPVAWTQILRDPRSRLYLYGLGGEQR